MAKTIIKIYETLGGDLTAIPKKKNILHMFMNFSKDPEYHDKYYHQIDGMLDHLFILAPDVSNQRRIVIYVIYLKAK